MNGTNTKPQVPAKQTACCAHRHRKCPHPHNRGAPGESYPSPHDRLPVGQSASTDHFKNRESERENMSSNKSTCTNMPIVGIVQSCCWLYIEVPLIERPIVSQIESELEHTCNPTCITFHYKHIQMPITRYSSLALHAITHQWHHRQTLSS